MIWNIENKVTKQMLYAVVDLCFIEHSESMASIALIGKWLTKPRPSKS